MSELNVIDCVLMLSMTMLFISIVIKFSSKIGLLDIPNARSSHVTPTPRGAGVAMFFSYMIIMMIFHMNFVVEYNGFFLALVLVFAVGVYDDNKGVSPKVKFIAIILATLLIFFINKFQIDTIGTWFDYKTSLPVYISLFLTIFAIVGFTNALNLLDGLDGLAGTISLVIFSSFLYIGYVYHDNFITTVSLMMISVLVAFLFFNWNPASIFMGDSGSLVLGFSIATVAIKALDHVSAMSIILLTALPIVDTLVVMTRRLQRGLSPFNPDKSHIHHKMLTWRGSVDYSVFILVTIQVFFSFIGVLFRNMGDEDTFFIVFIMMYLFFNFLDERKLIRDKLSITKLKKRLSFIIRKKISHKLAILSLVLFILVLLLIRLFL